MKAILTCLNTEYEYSHISSTGHKKRDYVGQVGTVIHIRNMKGPDVTKCSNRLYDIQFEDGAILCCDNEQIRILKEKK